jgi:hypothetical protein
MTEQEPTSSATSESSAAEKPRSRRTTNSRPKKSAMKKKAKEDKEPKKPARPDYPVFDLSESNAEAPPAVAEATASADWPEPEPASTGEVLPPQEGTKRKRRRKKGKGGSPQNAGQTVAGDATPEAPSEIPAAPAQTRPTQSPRAKADPEKVAKLALKIYLAEVSEEGVALIGDNDAKELSRRCFRLAEIFIEEESRRR